MKNLNQTGTLNKGTNQIETQSLPSLYKLATWYRKKQERPNVLPVMDVLVGQKRELVVEENHLELPTKKQMVSKSGEEKSEVVEVGSQPRQTQ